MAIPWILESKLAPPVPPVGWLTRLGLLQGPFLPPVTLLVAGPGAGKTLAMLSLLERTRSAGRVSVWYTLDAFDDDPVSFFQHLLAGMRAHIPDFARELDGFVTAQVPDPKRLWQGFFVALASYNLPAFALVLDDLHHLADAHPAWLKALSPWLERLPPNAHILLAARHALPLPAARLKAAGGLALLDSAKLRFDEGEEAAFLAASAPDEKTLAAWRERARSLDGWPLGLRLVASTDAATQWDGAADELTAYVAEELFQTQPAACQAFMLRAALLNETTAELCAAVMPDIDTAHWLAHTENTLAVSRLVDGVTYRFPAYLRDYLAAESKRVLSIAELSSIHIRAAAYYRKRECDEMALPHLLAAADFESAEEACRRCFPTLAAAGRYEAIERWLSAFPEVFSTGMGHLLLWRGHCLARRGDNAAALEAYAQSRRRFAADDDRPHELKALVRQCTTLAYAQESKRLNPLLLQAQALLADGMDSDLADFYLVRAMLAEHRGDMTLMRECNEAILGLLDPGYEVASARWIALVNLHALALHHGDLDAAARHAAEAIAVAVHHHFAPFELFARFLQANLQLQIGEEATAIAFVRGLAIGWEDLLEWQDRGTAYAIAGYAHQVRGAWREAEEALANSRAVFERANHHIGAKVAIERQVWGALARGQADRALALCAELPGGESISDAELELARARATHVAGRPAEAWAVWEPLIALLDEQDARLLATRSRLFAAATLAVLGRPLEAKQMLTRAITDLAARGYEFLRTREPEMWLELTPLLEPVTAALEAVPVSASASSAAAAPAKPARAKGVSSDSTLSGVADLEIRCFGGFEVLLAGRPLEQWPRRKAKLVLAALALATREVDTLGLAEALSEPAGEAAATAVRMAVLALRRVLQPDLSKGEASLYVRSTDTGYALVPERIAFADVQAFDNAMSRARKAVSEDGASAAADFELALGHYRGSLLGESLFMGCFDVERRRYQRDALEALDFLQAFHRGRGDRAAAEQALRRATLLAPCEEGPYVELMRFHQAAGQPERVRQAYWDYRKALKAHLGATPGAEFEAMYKTIAS